MKLIEKTMGKIAVSTAMLLAVWTVIFYFAITEEISDETDDSLELAAELVITDFLSGEISVREDNIGNNSYSIKEIDGNTAALSPKIKYRNLEIWIEEKGETEPARALSEIFTDKDGRYYRIEITTPTFDNRDLKTTLLLLMAILYIGIFSAVIGSSYVAIEKSMQPLYRLLEWMDGFDLKSNNAPIQNETDIEEFRMLNKSANGQVSRMKELYERQDRFVDNAAHEMQTPLAVAMNRIEEMQQTPGLSEEMLNSLSGINAPLKRLARLHRDMLNLSRIENGAFVEKQETDLTAMLSEMNEEFRDIFSYKEITCSEKNEGEHLRLKMNRTMAELLTGNLLRNAWVHTPANGRIAILTTDDGITVSNSGSKALDSTVIFERFKQGEDKSRGGGLGLAICDSICRQCGFHLTYRYENGMHFFAVTGMRHP